MSLPRVPHLAAAALAGLLVLAAVMFIAMLAGVEPHPPGIRGPYLGAVGALAVASLWLLLAGDPAGPGVGLVTALAFIPGVGPQKFWTEPAAPALAPLIVVGTLCVATVLLTLTRRLLAGHTAA